MELRVENDRPVVVTGTREALDPARLELDASLADALYEWARVAGTVGRGGKGPSVHEVVNVRGSQLARKLSVATGCAVTYVDPFTGRAARVREPHEGAATGPPSATVAGSEPTPWTTGVTVSVMCGLLTMLLTMLLSAALAVVSPWLGFVADIVLTAGLVPSVLLLRRMRVWRWVAYGIACGLAGGWLGWFGLLLGSP